MDREVSEVKFEQAIGAVRAFAAAMAGCHRWELIEVSYPVLRIVHTHPRSHRRVGFRYDCDEWDAVPPSLSLFDPADGHELTFAEWPQGKWAIHERHTQLAKPFLCLPGIREYHTHSSHVADLWENYRSRSSYSLGNIVHRVWQKFEETNG